MNRTLIQTVPYEVSDNLPAPPLTFSYNQPSLFPPFSFSPLFGPYQYATLTPESLQLLQTTLPQITTSNTFTNLDVAKSNNVGNNKIFQIENPHRQVPAVIPQHKEATVTFHQQKKTTSTLAPPQEKPAMFPHQEQPAMFTQTVCHPLVADDTEIIPTIQNIVATSNMGCQLDLKRISEKARNAEYNPKRFNAIVMRIKEPKSTALIFHSGKMVCLGTKSEESAKLASRKFARILQKLNFPVRYGDFKIQNIVGSCGVKFQIFLAKFQIEHHKFANYEPETFPGLIYKMVEPKITILVFASGKIVLTGAKKREDITRAYKQFYPILKQYKNNGQFISA